MAPKDLHSTDHEGGGASDASAERVLWQGRPDWITLANRALMLRVAMFAIAAMTIWCFCWAWVSGQDLYLATALWVLGLGVLGCLALAGTAWIFARLSTYTVTNRRIVLQVGVILRAALNIPYKKIKSAELLPETGATGSIALHLTEDAPLSYTICWPHVRPWRTSEVQPALRCIPHASWIAELIDQHIETTVTTDPVPAPDSVQNTATVAFATPLQKTKTATKMEGY